MRNLDVNPYQSQCPELLAQYSSTSDTGRNVRRGDAAVRLKEMLAAEASIREQEQIQAQIWDRIERLCAEHELNMQYLIQFGVTACERGVFQRILREVAEHGGLSLREAADLAHARYEVSQPAPAESDAMEM